MLKERIRNNSLVKLYRHYVIDSVLILKRSGARELIRQRGKKFLLFVISYYLIRDTILYIVIPLCIARGLI